MEVSPNLVGRRRFERRFLWTINWLGLSALLVAPLLLEAARVPDDQDLVRVYAAINLPAVVVVLGNWFHTRRTILVVNRVAVCESRLYPPFKPKHKLAKEDWFVPFKDIVSMVPVVEKAGFVPAYDVTLRDEDDLQFPTRTTKEAAPHGPPC